MSEKAQQPAPVVTQPAITNIGIKLNIAFAKSIPGIIRLLIILCQFCGWVSMASFFASRNSLREAYLTFSILGFLLSIAIFVFIFASFIERFPDYAWSLIIVISDLVWIIATFSLAIASAVDANRFYSGALDSASVFAFLSTFLYVSDVVFYGLQMKNSGSVNTPVTV